MTNMYFEDLVYDAVKETLKDVIIKEITNQKTLIKKILKDEFNKEGLTYMIKDMIKYDDVLADKMREISVEYFEKEIDNIFNKIIDK